MFLEILAPRTQSPIAKIRFFAGTARKFLTFLLSLSLTVSEGTAKGPSQNFLNARFSISDDLLPNANSYPTFRALSCPAYETFDGWRVTALGHLRLSTGLLNVLPVGSHYLERESWREGAAKRVRSPCVRPKSPPARWVEG